jgi:hypothetical protein
VPGYTIPVVTLQNVNPFAVEYSIKYWYSHRIDFGKEMMAKLATFHESEARKTNSVDSALCKPSKIVVLRDMVAIARCFGDQMMEEKIFKKLLAMLQVPKYMKARAFVDSVIDIFGWNTAERDIDMTFQQIAAYSVHNTERAAWKEMEGEIREMVQNNANFARCIALVGFDAKDNSEEDEDEEGE